MVRIGKFDVKKAKSSIFKVHGDSGALSAGVLLECGRIVTDVKDLQSIKEGEQILVSDWREQLEPAPAKVEHVHAETGVAVLAPPTEDDDGLNDELEYLRLVMDAQGASISKRKFPYNVKKPQVFMYCPEKDIFQCFDVVADKSSIGQQADLHVYGSTSLPPGLVPGMPIFLPDGVAVAVLRHDFKIPRSRSAIGVHLFRMALPGALYRHPGSWKALSESEQGPAGMYGPPSEGIPGMYDPESIG